MRISTTGNVGIGTTNPTSALQVVGNIQASGNVTTTTGTITAATINATTALQINGTSIASTYSPIASPTFTTKITTPAITLNGSYVATTYGKKIWVTGFVTAGLTGTVDHNFGASAATVSTTSGVSTIT